MSDVSTIIADNVRFLEQGISVLNRMTDEVYRSNQPLFGKGGIGRHIRHVLDHYTLFWEGLDEGAINYDDRARDIEIEHKRQRAVLLFEALRLQLIEWAESPIDLERVLQVQHNGTWCQSSVGRELQHLINHTVHHYAIVALILGVLDEEVDEGFGVAPSTLQAEMAK